MEEEHGQVICPKKHGQTKIMTTYIFGRPYQTTQTSDGHQWIRVGGGYQRRSELETRLFQRRLERQKLPKNLRRWSSTATYTVENSEIVNSPESLPNVNRTICIARPLSSADDTLVEDTRTNDSFDFAIARRPIPKIFPQKTHKISIESTKSPDANSKDFLEVDEKSSEEFLDADEKENLDEISDCSQKTASTAHWINNPAPKSDTCTAKSSPRFSDDFSSKTNV
ncbi:unnamed protein product [Bursaphelenchus xylophilus]|uniref:(pine wood nematode) hypothetical protein n=1 Tax=Bursaphelenchus xylophilus TaxID=6326 RepID=A0A1I7S6Z0_BURXY|nr:unnamed protein product [Bursaphelenchus xylophilus]CAG9079555.1 unnamed protein product [Bursaphelenchus xylophilus]